MSGTSCKSCIHADKCKILQTWIEGTGSFLKITKEWGFDIKIETPDLLAKGCDDYTSPMDLMKAFDKPASAQTTGV